MDDETEIRYALAADGVQIAYWTTGTGLPVILLHPQAMTHLERELEIVPLRSWYEALGAHVQVVRFSPRGFGMSEGDAAEGTLDEFVSDLDAVVRALGADRVGLLGSGIGMPTAVAYAARCPDRVARMVLFSPFLGYSGAELQAATGRSMAVARLGEAVWARRVITWVDPDGVADARAMQRLFADSVTAETHAAWAEAIRGMDVRPELSAVRAPTLVVRRKSALTDWPAQTIEHVAISGVRETTVEGSALVPYFEVGEETLTLIRDFFVES
jgi:pimeloyl-ACP methyl ester carboxylesterase